MSPRSVASRVARAPWKAALLLAACACAVAPRQGVEAGPAAPVYFPVGLTLAKQTTVPFALNDSASVVGSLARKNQPGLNGFVWNNGRVEELPKLKYKAAVATGINSLGEIVGAATLISPEVWHPLLWRNNLAIDLGPLVITPGGRSVGAFDINDQGQIVGGTGRAFLLDGDDFTDLGTLGGTGSEAFGINESGQIVGGADFKTGDEHAFLWQNGVMQDLGTLGGASSIAYGINESGQIVGVSSTSSGARRAFLWENGAMRSLGALPGHQVSEARAINDSGQVVGYSRRREGDAAGPTPVLWENGAIIDLQTRLGYTRLWDLSTAVDINNRGEIAATGSYLRRFGGVLLAPATNDISGGWTRLEARSRGLRAPQVTLDGVLTIRNGSSQGIGVQRVKLYLSSDAVVDSSDTLLSDKLFPAIGPGGSEPMRVHKRLSRGQNVAGRRVIAILDADDTYAEEDEANNTIVSGPL